MAEELLRSRHAFGNLEDIESAKEQKLVDGFDIIYVKDKNNEAYVGWVDKNGETVLVDHKDVFVVTTLPETGKLAKIYLCENKGYVWNGAEFIPLSESVDVSGLESQIAELESEVDAKVDAETVQAMINEKYSESVINVVEF